ncbi:Nn.00g089220.m01.CDS01 [Neocucurbitaria sp. VM-36]
MDRYPEVNVSERECAREDWSSSRHDSASSINKAAIQRSLDNKSHDQEAPAPPRYTSFPPPSTHSQQRTDSTTSSKSSSNEDKVQRLDAEFARYTDAPPPYSEQQYEGKSEQERTNMRMKDYAKEISRMMGRQLVRGLKTGQNDKSESK